MGNGNGLLASRVTQVIAMLAGTAIIATVSIGYAQSGIKVQVEANKKALEDRQAAVAAIPVIQADLRHIRETMDREHKQILRAIREQKR